MEIKQKVIFLDVDGVLNSATSFRIRGLGFRSINPVDHLIDDLDPRNIKVMNRIIKETGAEVVLSSSWRVMSTNRVIRAFHIAGLKLTYRYQTERTHDKTRGHEIKEFIDKYNIKNYVVIDDEIKTIETHIPRENIFKTEWQHGGLNDSLGNKIIQKLNTYK